ncbi:CYTH domain-containing protein [Neobacillus pocheonensis]|uniref:CYTH domain-containing protein n=1 Tax=Neobacillus pocheonensis TaxID=363869 RepID=UPI003D2BCCF6
MTQQVEIEFKNLLTRQEYERFLNEFNIDKKQIFTQENHYFDTSDFALKSRVTALRIRRKQDDYEMTLKQPADVGLLETNQLITTEEALHAFQVGELPFGNIKKIIEEIGISFSELKYFGSLLTNRVEVEYTKGLLVLDHSQYLNKEDYELEFEAENFQEGKLIFLQLLDQYHIPIRKTENKIQRFYNQKYANHEQI